MIETNYEHGTVVPDNSMEFWSAGVAVPQIGRQFIGIEMEVGFYGGTVERIRNVSKKTFITE